MTTPTETAILAFVAALQTASQVALSPLPAPLRNADLATRIVESLTQPALGVHLNVWDGDRANSDELLGADLGNTDAYEIRQHVRVEWAVTGGAGAAREQYFDDGRKAIWDALKPVMVGDVPTYLGGAVDGLMLVDIIPLARTTLEGLPNVKACEFVFELSFASTDPF